MITDRIQKYCNNEIFTAEFVPAIDAYKVTNSTGFSFAVSPEEFKKEYYPVMDMPTEGYSENGEKLYELHEVLLKHKETGELRRVSSSDFKMLFKRVV